MSRRTRLLYAAGMAEIIQLFTSLQAWQYLVVAANIALMVFAKPVLTVLANRRNGAEVSRLSITLMRGINLLILAVVLYPLVHQIHQTAVAAPALEQAAEALDPTEQKHLAGNKSTLALKLAQIIVVLYLAYFISYGRAQRGSETSQFSDTYRSRMLSLLLSTFTAVVALITVIRIAGFASLLEAGGVIGFIGVFLALTQAAWAPDIISGLLLLNSEMVSEGDVIEIVDGDPLLVRVFKTKIFHTVLVDLVDNHRVMIRNSRLRDMTIHNLSRFASARGLREKMTFKIGYDVPANQVRKLFDEAFASVCKDRDIAIDEKHPLEIRVLDTGDHAVEWGVFYYITDIVQRQRTRQLFIETILHISLTQDISLATPHTHVVNQSYGASV